MTTAADQNHSSYLAMAGRSTLFVTAALTYAAAGVVNVVSSIPGITASYAAGVTTVAFPTAPAGTVVGCEVQSATIEGRRVTTFSPTTGAMTFTTLSEDGGGVAAAADPAVGDVVYLTLALYESSGGY